MHISEGLPASFKTVQSVHVWKNYLKSGEGRPKELKESRVAATKAGRGQNCRNSKPSRLSGEDKMNPRLNITLVLSNRD